MANINGGNNGQMKQNTQANRPVRHDWSIDKVANKDLNGNQWPFKVTRDAGKPTKMVCRSITDLNKSFEGTPYNLNNCPVVKSRYTLLYEVLRDRYGNVLNKITHLYLTLDTVYFMTSDNPEVKYFTYAPNPLTVNDAQGIVNGLLYKSGVPVETIKKRFEEYKKTNDEYTKNQLIKDVREYIDSRKSMKVLDNNKYLIDVLKSELTFSSLKYLFFAPIPQMARDYQVCLLEVLKNMNISPRRSEKLYEELSKVINNRAESKGVKFFVDGLLKQDYYRSIVKVFYENNISDVSPEYVKKVFFDSVKSDYLDNNVYISEAEKSRIEEDKEEAQKNLNKKTKASNIAKEPDEKEKNDLIFSIQESYAIICDIIKMMVAMQKESQFIYDKGQVKNDVETEIWMRKYNPKLMQERLDAMYGYKSNKSEVKIPILTILDSLSKNDNFNSFISLTEEELKIFDKYLKPAYFKDDRGTLNSIGCDMNTIEGLRELKNKIVEIQKKVIELFEIYLGLQYATFGSFMIRYGAGGGLDIAKILVKDLTESLNEPFVLPYNVKVRCHEAFYLVHLDNSDFSKLGENFDANTMKEVMGEKVYYFVDTYLSAINKQGVVDEKIENLKEYSEYGLLCESQKGVKKIIHFACDKYDLVKIEDLKDEMIMTIRNKGKSI